METDLSYEQKIYFRDLFREARASAQKNAENYGDLLFALEKLGSCLRGEKDSFGSLGKFKPKIGQLASKSSLAIDIPKECPEFHIVFSKLYTYVNQARNSVMHEGAFARHLTQHAAELSIILEDALMGEEKQVKDFMVKNPICAALWQPISFLRQNMLLNSFSYLPVSVDNQWYLVSDFAITKYLREVENGEKFKRMSRKLQDAIELKQIEISPTRAVTAEYPVKELLNENWDGLPVCVISAHSNEIVGILTPFDLL